MNKKDKEAIFDDLQKIIKMLTHKYPFWLSIKKKEKCLFSRRNGIVGKIIKGYSVRLRLFGIDII
ncbi:MAG TPA: hypothetical protein DCO75_07570 [Fibrobacteres bacterium]|jgi:hypothetical protein|nr:hypothetical protein [Fibrobacterota bacterium]